MRRLGIRAGARLWGLAPREALVIAAGLPARNADLARALRRVLQQVEGE